MIVGSQGWPWRVSRFRRIAIVGPGLAPGASPASGAAEGRGGNSPRSRARTALVNAAASWIVTGSTRSESRYTSVGPGPAYRLTTSRST